LYYGYRTVFLKQNREKLFVETTKHLLAIFGQFFSGSFSPMFSGFFSSIYAQLAQIARNFSALSAQFSRKFCANFALFSQRFSSGTGLHTVKYVTSHFMTYFYAPISTIVSGVL